MVLGLVLRSQCKRSTETERLPVKAEHSTAPVIIAINGPAVEDVYVKVRTNVLNETTESRRK